MNRSFPLLVVEANPDHHLLIGYSCRLNPLPVAPVFATTPEEALNYLKVCATDKSQFPKVVLLDLLLPRVDTGLQLIRDIRTAYPRLPIIVLSNHQNQDDIQLAYDLGVNSFISKPVHLQAWEDQFQIILSYWLNVVTLAPS